MGHCTIVVHAVGAHHNKNNDSDIDKMAAKFVADLKAKGHTVHHASLTNGGHDDLRPHGD